MKSWIGIAMAGPQLSFMLLILSGCAIMNPNQTGVEAEAHSQNLYIVNHTAATVHYVVFPRDMLSSVAWKPCVDPHCHSEILPQQKAIVPYAEFLGEMKDNEAVIYWWHLLAKGDQGYQMDELHTIVVKL
ncbi:MAG: hypothetical protein ACREOO_00095 [bacterium]